MSITGHQLVGSARKALQEGWGYVWGGQGHFYNRDLAIQWGNAKRSGKTYEYYVFDCAKWFGKVVVDCSGLLVEVVRDYDEDYKDRNSTAFFSESKEKGPISTIPDIPGIGVWRQGHVGLYVGGGKIIEARGVNYGVVETTVKGRNFTHWFKIAGVTYTGAAVTLPDEDEESVDAFRLNRLLKYEPVSGTDVADVQRALEERGYLLGDVNGKYDQLTYESVRQFQIEHKLTVDGIVGKQTATALGGLWIV